MVADAGQLVKDDVLTLKTTDMTVVVRGVKTTDRGVEIIVCDALLKLDRVARGQVYVGPEGRDLTVVDLFWISKIEDTYLRPLVAINRAPYS